MTSFRTVLASALVAVSAVFAAQAAPIAYPTPGVQAPVTGAFTSGLTGLLVGYYTGLRGGYTNLAGVQVNGVDAAIGLNNQTSAYGDRFVFGRVSAGDSLQFFIDVLDTGSRYYGDPTLNADGINHMWVQSYGGDALVPAGFHLAFEDIAGGGDFNYADHSFVIGVEASSVPEPATWALLLGGLSLLGLRAKGRQPH